MSDSDPPPGDSSPPDAFGAVNATNATINVARDLFAGDQINIAEEAAYDVRSCANPYIGLSAFTYDGRAKYAGRANLIKETVSRITAPCARITLLFITGASGSGKSSFAQAGLIPALEDFYKEFKPKFAIMRPAGNPLDALNDALWRQLRISNSPAALAPNASRDDIVRVFESSPESQINLLVIDQFEEFFTQASPSARDTLFGFLINLPPFSNTRTHILATLRADYLPELYNHKPLYEIAKQQGVDLRAMTGDELKQAIQQPLRASECAKTKRFEPALVDKLARDAAEDDAYLPLLQVTLQELWRKGYLKHGAYTNLTDALKQRADQIIEYTDFDVGTPGAPRAAAEQAEILNILLDLVDVSLDDDPRRDVRRRRHLQELAPDGSNRKELVQTLAHARLLGIEAVPNQGARAKGKADVNQNSGAGGGAPQEDNPDVVVDLIHESLLTNWDRLKQAIAARREELKQRARFEQAVARWLAQARAAKYLLVGVGLEEARELQARNDVALSKPDALELYRESIANQKKELEKERRNARFFRLAAIGLFGLLLIALVAAFYAFQQQQAAASAEANAVRQRDLAQTGELIASADLVRASDPRESVRLAARALRQAVDLQDQKIILRAENSLHDALAQLIPIQSFTGHSDRLLDLDFSHDSSKLVTTGEDSKARVWNVKTGEEIYALQGYTEAVTSAQFSPDDTLLVTAGRDGRVLLWDAAAGQQSPRTLLEKPKEVYKASFSPDGKEVVTASQDGTVTLVNVATRAARTLSCHGGLGASTFEIVPGLAAPAPCSLARVNDARFNPANPAQLVTAGEDGTSVIWDLAQGTRQILKAHLGSVVSAAFDSSGDFVVTAGVDQTAWLWDAHTAELVNYYREHTAQLTDAEFSPDGTQIVTASFDGTARVYDTDTAKLVAIIRGHTQPVRNAVFAPNGETIATSSYDGKARLWNLTANGYEFSVMRTALDPFNPTDMFGAVFSHNSESLITLSLDGVARTWDADESKLQNTKAIGALAPSRAAFRSDGALLATIDPTNSLEILDTTTWQPIASHNIPTHSFLTAVQFSPNGQQLYVGDKAGSIWVIPSTNNFSQVNFLVDTGIPVTSLAGDDGVKVLATTNFNSPSGTISLWYLETKPYQARTLKGHSDPVVMLALNRDGTRLVSASRDRTAHIWNVASGESEHTLSGHSDYLNSASFSPDGDFIVTTSDDKSAILWDAQDGTSVMTLRAHVMPIKGATFSPNGKYLATVSDDGTARVYATRPLDLLHVAATLVPAR